MNKQFYPRLDETVFSARLENGLTVKVVPRRGFTKRLAYLAVNYGSIHRSFTLEGREYQVPAGIAHYLEHKLFDMPDGSDISAAFAALGASDNAFTSFDMTAYHFSCTKNFEACLELLLKLVSTPCFTPESVEKERGIIDQEIAMDADNPDSVLFQELARATYHTHDIRTDVLGTRDSIRQITAQTLYLCHRAFYAPGNALLCVIGDVDPDDICRMALEILGPEERPVGVKLRPWAEPMTVCTPQTSRAMEVAMPMFELAFKCEPTGTGDAAIREELLADLAAEVLFGESSALYLRLYQEGLIDSSFGGGFETVDGCSMLLCSGDSEDPLAVREAVLARAEELCRDGVDPHEFLRLKRSALGRRIRSLDSFDATAFRICAYHFSDFDYFRFPEVYESICPEEITAFLSRVVRRERCAISIITPNETEEAP